MVFVSQWHMAINGQVVSTIYAEGHEVRAVRFGDGSRRDVPGEPAGEAERTAGRSTMSLCVQRAQILRGQSTIITENYQQRCC